MKRTCVHRILVMFRFKAARAALGIAAFLTLAGCAHRHCHAAPIAHLNDRASLHTADRGCETSRPRYQDHRPRHDEDEDDDRGCPLVLRSEIELSGKRVNVELTLWREDGEVHTRIRLTPCGKGNLPDIDSLSLRVRAGGSNWRPSLCEVRSCDKEIIYEAHDGPSWCKGRTINVDLRVKTSCDNDRVRWLGETLD